MPTAWLATTLVAGSPAQHAVTGVFRVPRPSDGAGYDIVLGKETSIELYETHPSGLSLRQLSCQQLWASISDLRLRPRPALHPQQQQPSAPFTDQVILLSSSGNVSILQYSSEVSPSHNQPCHWSACMCCQLFRLPVTEMHQSNRLQGVPTLGPTVT